jgi:hypothetical protein
MDEWSKIEELKSYTTKTYFIGKLPKACKCGDSRKLQDSLIEDPEAE